MLNRHAARAKAEWQDAEQATGGRDRALGHENDRDAGGPHILERSFSGTYDRERRDD